VCWEALSEDLKLWNRDCERCIACAYRW